MKHPPWARGVPRTTAALATLVLMATCVPKEPAKNHRVMMSLTRREISEISADYAKHYPEDVRLAMESARDAGASRNEILRGAGRVAARYGVSDWTIPTGETGGRSRTVEFVRVGRKFGSSPIGHVGLRIDDSVYHYRALSLKGLLVCSRFRWDDFVERYCLLGGRSLEIERLKMSDEAAQRIEDRLKRLCSIQEKHRDRLDALQLETRWLTALGDAGAAPPQIRGLGYFEMVGAGGSARTQQLRENIEAQLGVGFVSQELAGVTAKIRRVALESSDPRSTEIVADEFPEIGEVAAERLRDLLTLREALLTLEKGRGLDGSALQRPGGARLTTAERVKLGGLATRSVDSIARLLRSARPDRGTPILIASARYLAIQRSLQEGQFALLDRLSIEVSIFDRRRSRKQRELIESLEDKSREEWQALRAEAFAGQEGLDEFRFGLVEMAGTRCAELAASRQRGWARFGDLHGLPGVPGPATPLPMEVGNAQLARALAHSRRLHTRYEAALQNAHGFDTLGNNCCTGIIGAIRSAFPDEAAARAALGGEIDPGSGLSMMPTMLSREIRRCWTVEESRSIAR